jgi:AcrR family transcriptional regulator
MSLELDAAHDFWSCYDQESAVGPTDRKARERAARREAILEAARAVFAEKGLRASTIDDIAEAAELGKGTIYLYFKSKEQMFAALKLEGLARLAARFQAAIDPALPADQNMRRLCDAYVRFYREEPDYYWVLYFDTRYMDKDSADEVVETLKPEGMRCIRIVADVIQRGMDDGLVAPSIDALQAAIVAWASSSGVIFVFGQQAGPAKVVPFGIDDVLRTQTEIFINGLKADRPRGM